MPVHDTGSVSQWALTRQRPASHLPIDISVVFDIVLTGFDVRDGIHAGLATQHLHLVDVTGQPKNFTQFLFLTAPLGLCQRFEATHDFDAALFPNCSSSTQPGCTQRQGKRSRNQHQLELTNHGNVGTGAHGLHEPLQKRSDLG